MTRSKVAGTAAGKHAERAPGTGRFAKKPAATGEPATGSADPPPTPPKPSAPPADGAGRASLASKLLRGSLGDVFRGR
jgi:hypothetical protein